MKHARQDYDRIQDPAGLIPEDEPVFLLRGQDRAAAAAVRYWAETAGAFGADPEILQAARDQAGRMERWRTHKVPDMPAEAQPAPQPPEGPVRAVNDTVTARAVDAGGPEAADPAAIPERASGWVDVVAAQGLNPDVVRAERARWEAEIEARGIRAPVDPLDVEAEARGRRAPYPGGGGMSEVAINVHLDSNAVAEAYSAEPNHHWVDLKVDHGKVSLTFFVKSEEAADALVAGFRAAFLDAPKPAAPPADAPQGAGPPSAFLMPDGEPFPF